MKKTLGRLKNLSWAKLPHMSSTASFLRITCSFLALSKRVWDPTSSQKVLYRASFVVVRFDFLSQVTCLRLTVFRLRNSVFKPTSMPQKTSKDLVNAFLRNHNKLVAPLYNNFLMASGYGCAPLMHLNAQVLIAKRFFNSSSRNSKFVSNGCL